MIELSKEFWGEQGRVALLTRGEFAGRYIFVYPETVDSWWTAYVSPSFEIDAPGELYIEGTDELDRLNSEWGFEWLDRDDHEVALERERFGLRPLVGPRSWLS